MHFILCLFTLFLACGSESHEAHFTKSPSVKIREKVSSYCQLSRADFIQRKWAVDECDGLLFTALRGIACDDVDLSLFESSVEPGQWYRNPNKDCFIADKIGEQGSDSTISKDMYLGLIAYLLHKKDSDALRRTIEYGKSHDWIVGQAKDTAALVSKCFVTPSLQNLLKDAYNSLGGSLTDVYQEAQESIGINTGYAAHLDVLGILIRGKIDGHISSFDLTILKEQAKRQPRNALFQAVKSRYDDGDFDRAVELLLDESLFPAESLPNNHRNYCTSYLYQRDDDPSDWAPCPNAEFRQWDGTDFVFAAAIVEGMF